MHKIYTIGHSNHEIEVFVGFLRQHGVTALGDVRSHPYSRHVPQYSREALRPVLADFGIVYVFLGKELGARSGNPACYTRGKVQYDLLAKEPCFASGLQRIMRGMERYNIALMCAERDPLYCHRALLVARKLVEAGIMVNHIHANGFLEPQRLMESRLLALCKLPEGDMFKSREEFVAEAYAIQGARVAYQDEVMASGESIVTK